MLRFRFLAASFLAFAGAASASAGVNPWTQLGPYGQDGAPLSCESLAVSPDGTTLYAGVDSAIYRSEDGGASWTRFEVPTPGGVLELLLSPTDSSVVYAGTGSGFFRSDDRGATWTASGLDGQPVFCLVGDPQLSQTLFASTWEIGPMSVTGILNRSDDGGAHWTVVATQPEDRVVVLAIDPRDDARMFAGTAGGVVLRTTDGGQTWAAVDQVGPVDSLIIDSTRAGVVYSSWQTTVGFEGSVAGGALRRSTDGGASWSDVPGFSDRPVSGLLSDPLEASVLYVQAGQIVYRSIDAGDSWTAIAQAPFAASVATSGGVPTSLFALGAGVSRLDVAAPGPCEPGPTSLCLQQGRFRVEVSWQLTPSGPSFQAHAVPVTTDSGYFWFFDADNVELMVKVLDGRGVNGYFWVFAGALSSVEYEITVTDTATGQIWTHINPWGALASVADTAAFLDKGGPAPAMSPPGLLVAPKGEVSIAEGCEPDGLTLCLNDGRFHVSAAWQATPSGPSIAAHAVTLTGDTGSFWFFDAANIELVLKVLDGTAVNGHFWVFYGALSTVEYTITVTDGLTGEVREYHNDHGTLASVADTTAF